ncbi:MAG: hypothetical protein SVV03_02665 [Candidatus Nanohaloarchaea archaeon]|nr:hypothetical protein [Candidatus Nanohaloarchaea archaeon]
MKLDGLRQNYGDKAMVCPQCGRAIDVESLIDSMENNPENVIFTPKKVQDLCFTWCDNCDELQLHEMKDKDNLENDTIVEYSFSKSEDGTESGEQANSGRKPFSVSN